MIRENRTMPKVVTLTGVFHLLRDKWICLLLLVAICAGITGTRGVFEQRKKVQKQAGATEKEVKLTVDESEFLNVQSTATNIDVIAEKQKYVDESLLMNIDPMAKWNGNIRFRFVFDGETKKADPAGDAPAPAVDYEALRQKLADAYCSELRKQESAEQIRELAGIEADVSCVNEIMGFETTSIPGTLYIWAVQKDADSMASLMAAIETTVGQWKDLGKEIGGGYSVITDATDIYQSVDEPLLDTQSVKKNEIAVLQAALAVRMEQLTEEEKTYLDAYLEARNREGYEEGGPIVRTEPVKPVSKNYGKVFLKEGVKGAAAGLVLGFVLAFLIYLLSPVIITKESVSDLYDLPVFASVKKGEDGKEASEYMQKLILGRKREGLPALISSREDLLQTETITTLTEELKKSERECIVASQISQKTRGIDLLQGAEDVYLIEKIGKSRHRNIEKELLVCEELGLRVAGVMLV